MKLKCIRKTLSDSLISLKLEGEFNIYTVKKLQDLFNKELQNFSGLDLDLGGIIKFDSAGYQLLEHTRMLAEKQGRSLQLVNKSEDAAKLLTLYGSGI